MEEREIKGDDEQHEPAETGQEERAATPEDFEEDPARNPEDEALKDIKGG